MKNICPISSIIIDSNVVRLTSFLTMLLLFSGLIFNYIYLFIFFDFFLRSTRFCSSPLTLISKKIVKFLKLKIKPIDAAPKIFAARIGLILSFLVLFSLYFNLNLFFYIFIIMFILAAFLASILNYCLGCKFYSILISLKIIKQKTKNKK